MTTLALDTMPPLTVFPHPLTTGGKSTFTAPFLPRETLGRYVERNEVDLPRQTFAIWHNGQRVMPTLWDRLIPRDGDHIILRSTVQGGGGGGSKVLRTVAMVALSLSAPWMAGYLQTGAWVAASGFTGAALTAGIMIGGSLMIAPLIPEIKQ